MNVPSNRRYVLNLLMAFLFGCASPWVSKYGEPTLVNVDGLEVAVYVKAIAKDSYDVVSLNATGLRRPEPLDDARRYKRAAEMIMAERCGKNSDPKIFVETNHEGIAGRFFEYACILL